MTSAASGYDDASSLASWFTHLVARNDAGVVAYVTVTSWYCFSGSSLDLLHTIRCRLLSSGCTRICRYILDMSAVIAYVCIRNLNTMDIRSCWIVGPTMSMSFSETPVVLLADASKTTRVFVVVLLSLKKAWWGRKNIGLFDALSYDLSSSSGTSCIWPKLKYSSMNFVYSFRTSKFLVSFLSNCWNLYSALVQEFPSWRSCEWRGSLTTKRPVSSLVVVSMKCLSTSSSSLVRIGETISSCFQNLCNLKSMGDSLQINKAVDLSAPSFGMRPRRIQPRWVFWTTGWF